MTYAELEFLKDVLRALKSDDNGPTQAAKDEALAILIAEIIAAASRTP